MDRYERQIIMPSIGEGGQRRLGESSVLVIGAGGLGSPVLYYLCAAGIGNIGIVDFDTVSISNLNRQIIHNSDDVRRLKTISARNKLHALSPNTQVDIYNTQLDDANAGEIISGYDIVVDCVDNIDSRLLVARACIEKKPLVEGGIESFSGFVTSYTPGNACYGCLYGNRETDIRDKIPVLGATAGVVGSLQAAECIKLLLDIGEPLINKVQYIDLLYQDYETIELLKNPDCLVCGGHKDV